MSIIIPLLIIFQGLGALGGAFSAVWAEIAYLRAIRDGKIDAAERRHLAVIAHSLRFGMSLLLLSSFGLVLIAYLMDLSIQPAVTESYWLLIGLALVTIATTWALSRKLVSFRLGSAVVFTAWWFLAYLTFGFFPTLSLLQSIALVVTAGVSFYLILSMIRFYGTPEKHRAPKQAS